MLEQIVFILIFVVVAALLQNKLKVPLPVSLVAQAAFLRYFDVLPHTVSAHQFDSLVLISLPLLIAADSLKLNLEELKEHAISLFSLAVLLVIGSVVIGSYWLKSIVLFQDIPFAAVIMLFCMVCATDPVTVSAIFSNFEVPHELKMLTEGESLFNDATALIIFGLALTSLADSDSVSAYAIASRSLYVVGGAFVIGIASGILGYFLLKSTTEPFIEAACLLLVAYFGYFTAETFHCSGILAVVIGCLFANNQINKYYSGSSSILDFKVPLFNEEPSTLHNMQIVHKSIDFVSLFAAAALFVSIGAVLDMALMAQYWREILIVFIVSTFIRFAGLCLFGFVSNRISLMTDVKTSWIGVLTFAGSKGALSILMVHLIPSGFTWKPQLEQIVIGNILLSILVYAPILLSIIVHNKKDFCSQQSV